MFSECPHGSAYNLLCVGRWTTTLQLTTVSKLWRREVLQSTNAIWFLHSARVVEKNTLECLIKKERVLIFPRTWFDTFNTLWDLEGWSHFILLSNLYNAYQGYFKIIFVFFVETGLANSIPSTKYVILRKKFDWARNLIFNFISFILINYCTATSLEYYCCCWTGL